MVDDELPDAAVNLVVALAPEAAPLIQRFGLERVGDGPFAVYRAARRGAGSPLLQLVVSGVGKFAAACAVGHLAAASGEVRQHAWLNVGLAGHSHLDVGDVRLAHKITEVASGAVGYPVLAFAPPCAREELRTVDRPELEFAATGLYDMEGAGFFAAATRYSSAELVQCLKVVSDNPSSPAHRRPSASAVRGWIGSRLEAIEHLIRELGALAAEARAAIRPPADFEDIVARWRFSATQRVQLVDLLRRWAAIRSEESARAVCAHASDSRAALAALRVGLTQRRPSIHPVAPESRP